MSKYPLREQSVAAVYDPACEGNPFLAALPDVLSREAFLESIRSLPPLPSGLTAMSPEQHRQHLPLLSSLFIPMEYMYIRSLIVNHTLFPYFTRCYPISQKEKLLAGLCSGDSAEIASTRHLGKLPAPRYCPACAEEDRRTYGEVYWHIEHQIPILEVCPKHERPLLTFQGIDNAKIKTTFFPLETQQLDFQESTPALPQQHLRFFTLLQEYITLPLNAAAHQGHSNLAVSLCDMGYEVIERYGPGIVLDVQRLYHDLVKSFGRVLVEKVFGGEKSACYIKRICTWDCLVPERYAMLQCFAGMDSSDVFSPRPRLSTMESRLRKMQKSGVTYGKQQLCEILGITNLQLNILSQRYQLTPFWTRQGGQAVQSKNTVKVFFNDAEYELFKQAQTQNGFRYSSHFAHHCITEYLNTHFPKED